jgi:hypothetical protein
MSTDPDASVDPDALADELSGIITALESTPDNVGLLRREIAIMRELEMMPEAIDTTLRLSALVMVEECEILIKSVTDFRLVVSSLRRASRGASDAGELRRDRRAL